MAVLLAMRESRWRPYQILYLILALQSLDKRFLRQILRIVDVPDNSVNLKKNAAEILLNEA
ncbi:MAG: hypothetical protein WKF37_19760 [Bryobacteraceae bacterium]